MFPTKIVGVPGPTASCVRVGFTKNPRQPTARASAINAAKALTRRSFDVFDDMMSGDSSTRVLGLKAARLLS